MADEDRDAMTSHQSPPIVGESPSPARESKPKEAKPAEPKLREPKARDQKVTSKRQPAELIAGAREQLHKLLGYNIDSVAGFEKADGGWHLSVMVIELHRIPAATDVLATYEVDLDDVGDVVSYHRGKRFYRDQVGDET